MTTPLIARQITSPPCRAIRRAPRRAPKIMASQRSLDTHHSQDKRIVAAAADRNKDHILEVLKNYIPASPPATVLEVASGTGQHAHHFAASFPHLTWQPSEATDEMFESIAAWAEDVPNINAPLLLDCSSPPHAWPVPESSCAAVLCINMAHISPWAATAGLCAGAGRVLRPGGVLIVYGPFKADGKPTTPSNADFDALLRSRNAEWGLRDVAEVDAVAQSAGLKRIAMVPMPANNFSLVYNKI